MPPSSVTARFQRDPQNITDAKQLEETAMLDEWMDGAPRIEVNEDVVGLGHYGKTLTVLFTDESLELEDDDPADEDFETRWGRR